MSDTTFYRLINRLPAAIEESLYDQPSEGGWIVGPPGGGFGKDNFTFVYEDATHPPNLLSARFTGGIASFLVRGSEVKAIFERFRWRETFRYAARVRWQDEVLEDYTLFDCFNFVQEEDLNFERTPFFVVDRKTQRAIPPSPKFQEAQDIDRWHAATEEKHGPDTQPPVELRIDRLCLAPSFARQSDAFLIGFGYVPRYYRSTLFVSSRLKNALEALPIYGLAFEATDYVEV